MAYVQIGNPPVSLVLTDMEMGLLSVALRIYSALSAGPEDCRPERVHELCDLGHLLRYKKNRAVELTILRKSLLEDICEALVVSENYVEEGVYKLFLHILGVLKDADTKASEEEKEKWEATRQPSEDVSQEYTYFFFHSDSA